MDTKSIVIVIALSDNVDNFLFSLLIAIILVACIGRSSFYPVPIGTWIMTGILAIGAILTGKLQLVHSTCSILLCDYIQRYVA